MTKKAQKHNPNNLRVIPHPFKEFVDKYAVRDDSGFYCGRIGNYTEFSDMEYYHCPKVFNKPRAVKFLINVLKEQKEENNVTPLLLRSDIAE